MSANSNYSYKILYLTVSRGTESKNGISKQKGDKHGCKKNVSIAV